MLRIALALFVMLSKAQCQNLMCEQFLDVVIVVDGSSSVGRFVQAFRSGLGKIVSAMDIDDATKDYKVQLGICYFGSQSLEVVPMSLPNTQSSVLSAINSTNIPGGRTRYFKGIICASNNFLRAHRPGAKQRVVLVVDGNPDRSAVLPTEKAVQGMKDAGIVVSVIAVGRGFVNKTRVKRFASEPSLFLDLDTFSDFDNRTDAIFSTICEDIAAQVNQSYGAWNEADNSQDIQGMTSQCTEDCIFYPPNGPPILGRQALVEFYENLLKSGKWPKRKILTLAGIIEKSDEVVVAQHTANMETYDGKIWTGSGLWVFRIEKGLIKLRAVIWNADAPLVPKAAVKPEK